MTTLSLNKSKKYIVSFLIPYFGDKLPEYLNYFLHSCKFNPNFEFIFFTNLNPLSFPLLSNNVKIIPFSKSRLQELIFRKIGIKPDLSYFCKIVDFKPAFGAIFSDYISSPFWGHIDIDLILGDLLSFLKEIDYSKYDILSFRKDWLSGSCAIYRNKNRINYLFQQGKDWNRILTTKKHLRFDEAGIPNDKSVNIYSFLNQGGNLQSLPNEIDSFTHVLKRSQGRGDIKIFFQTKIIEDLKNTDIVEFSKGTIALLSPHNLENFIAYHYIGEKRRVFFYNPNWISVPDYFVVTRWGFHTNKNAVYGDIFIRFLRGLFFGYYFRMFNRVQLYLKKRKNLLLDI